jgi:tRNA A-37 threonylcarbamoyl transferase component Bud32
MFEGDLKFKPLDSIQNRLRHIVSENQDSTLYFHEYDGYTKIFKSNVSPQEIDRKYRILIDINSRKTYERYDMIPEIYQFLSTKNEPFCGYSMNVTPGQNLNEYSKYNAISDILFLFKNLQSRMVQLHKSDLCFANLNPKNILIYKDTTIKFLDVDNLCFMNESLNGIAIDRKYACRFTNVINVNSNIYSYYCLLIDMLLGVNLENNTKKEIINEIS